MIRFTRKLTKKITNTGTCYTLAVPREIADELKLPDGGLVSLRIWAHRNEVLVENYEDSWKATIEIFDPARVHSGDGTYGFVDVEVKPKTRGRSRGFVEGKITDPTNTVRQLKLALRWVKADCSRAYPPRRRRRRR